MVINFSFPPTPNISPASCYGLQRTQANSTLIV